MRVRERESEDGDDDRSAVALDDGKNLISD